MHGERRDTTPVTVPFMTTGGTPGFLRSDLFDEPGGAMAKPIASANWPRTSLD